MTYRYAPEGFMTTCSYDLMSGTTANRVYIAVFATGAFFVPFVAILSSYIGICKHVADNCPKNMLQVRTALY
jgi:hypothetical protein